MVNGQSTLSISLYPFTPKVEPVIVLFNDQGGDRRLYQIIRCVVRTRRSASFLFFFLSTATIATAVYCPLEDIRYSILPYGMVFGTVQDGS